MYIGIEVDRSVHMCYFTISDITFLMMTIQIFV